jgi:hypothetical protein
MIRVILLIISAGLTVLATLPYLIDVVHKKTKPRIVSWFNWALLGGIAGAAAIAARQYPAATVSLAASLECMLVVLFGLKLGDHKFEFFDIACQAGAIFGLVLWIIFNSPLIAIIASVVIDLIVSLPTLKHVWQKPHEETAALFILSASGAAFALAAVHHPRISGLIVPVYLVVINLLMFGLFFMTPSRHKRTVIS